METIDACTPIDSNEAAAEARGRAGPMAVGRVLAALDVLAAAQGPIGLAEMSRRLSVPKASLLALLAELVQQGHARRDEDGRYVLGGRAYRLGLQISVSGALSALVRRTLAEVSAELQMTVAFGYLDRESRRLVYGDRCAASGPVRRFVRLGEPLEIHSRAIGKLLLAHEPEADWPLWLGAEPYPRRASRTHTQFEPLAEELRQIRSQGAAWAESEQYDGTGGCARPVLAHDGTVAAGIGVQAKSEAVQRRRTDVLAALREASEAIGQELQRRRIDAAQLPLYI